MRLRVRHPNGTITLDALNPDQMVFTLRQAIAQALDSPVQNVQVSGGYPPKPFTDDSKSLQAAGIRHGDTVNVTLIDSALTATAAAATAPSPISQKMEPAPTSQSNAYPGDIEAVETTGGYLVLRQMADDNSCLFRSIVKQCFFFSYVLNRDIDTAQSLRAVVAQGIEDDPITYSDATLGKDREKYMQWIQKDSSWGGAIELSILSKYFAVEIDSIDVQTGRIDKFGEGAYSERVLIVYSGIHYDALALAPTIDCPTDFDQTRFSAAEDDVLEAAKKLASLLRQKRKYTDVANFTLKCNQCQAGLVGEKDARNHAAATGHTHFVEY